MSLGRSHKYPEIAAVSVLAVVVATTTSLLFIPVLFSAPIVA